MLCLNLRKGNSTILFGAAPEWSEFPSDTHLTNEQAAARLSGRRVLVLIHGYNVEDVWGAFAEVALQVSPWYDAIVGVPWPGSKLDLAFWLARMRAGKAGKMLAAALAPIKAVAAALDIEGHSLGCMVALETLTAGLRCRNLILTAAAVDNESIQVGERYWDATQRAERVLVAYSRHDPVLAGAYRFAMVDRALGLTGPETPKFCATWVIRLDLSSVISGHSEYKRCPELFEAWKRLAS